MNQVAAESWAFPPDPASCREARRRVTVGLESSQPDAVVHAVALVVSELATNAVLHSKTQFEVRVVTGDAVVRIEVHDQTRRKPGRRYFSDESTSGRGLRLVEELCVAWGMDLDVDGIGKTVWAELSTTGNPSAASWFDLDPTGDSR